ncbi:TonB-dependent receptor domain-containing protein [Litorimonas sp. RW-G-Af-16]|uniref:TonB-dependent receptor domain-containing protein n=1 Tax=Litorimonas sp. RW-G-Af-16 TaxID=3241168 RepID=UPI003AAB58AB
MSSLLCSAILSAAPAFAQDTADEVIVTGSLIPRSTNLQATSPVTEIGAADFEARGVLRVEDIINTLPQAFGAQGSNLANGATGTSSINLRGLGATRNLVLINGKRMPYGSLNTAAADVNMIPSALVKKVDILTGGASATYGSDAVSGVANFIMDKEFEGARLDTNFSFYQHNNNNSEIQDILSGFAADNPSQYTVPNGGTTDGESLDITGIVGGKFAEDRGHITAYAGYQKTKPIQQADRDYSQCALSTRNDGEDFTCAGSSTNQFANILDVTGGYTIPGIVNPDARTQGIWSRVNPDNGEFRARDFTTDTFNFNPFNNYQRPNERYTFGTFVEYEAAPNLNLYSELMFMENSTNSQIAPSGVFGLGVNGSAGGVNCDNPFLSAQQVEYLCGEIADGAIDRYRFNDPADPDNPNNGLYTDAAGNILPDQDNPDTFVARFDGNPDQAALAADGVAPVLILRRNVEGGNRNNDITHTTFRGLVGAKGDLSGTPLSYDVSASYSSVRRAEVYNNDLSITNISRALNVVNAGGVPTCAVNADAISSNDDANCVPYDIFSGAAPDQAAIDYIRQPLLRSGKTTQTVINGTLTGTFGDNVAMPWAESPIGFAAGVEYRLDTLDSNPDANFQSGDGAGQGGPTNPIEGEQDVYDVFAEMYVPLIEGRPGAEVLALDLGYRRSHYSNNTTDSYKVAGEWAPTNDIRFRGGYQRAVRAANIFELFAAQSIGLFDLTAGENDLFDPCSGPSPQATAAQCANTGVTPDQYGTIADNPAGQFNNFTGGNPDLAPEKANTFTVGFTATPSMIEGLTVSLDYFDIKVDDFIDTVSENQALNSCLETGAEFFCSLINRGTGGTLWANNTGFITATNINTGYTQHERSGPVGQLRLWCRWCG